MIPLNGTEDFDLMKTFSFFFSGNSCVEFSPITHSEGRQAIPFVGEIVLKRLLLLPPPLSHLSQSDAFCFASSVTEKKELRPIY